MYPTSSPIFAYRSHLPLEPLSPDCFAFLRGACDCCLLDAGLMSDPRLLASQGAWPRTCYFLVSHAVSGILHVQITLSHFSMDVTEKPQYR